MRPTLLTVATVAAWLVAAPASAQYDYNLFTDEWERSDPSQSPSGYQDPYLSDERRMRQMEEGIQQEYENTRELGRTAPCDGIWNNDAAQQRCYDRLGR